MGYKYICWGEMLVTHLLHSLNHCHLKFRGAIFFCAQKMANDDWSIAPTKFLEDEGTSTPLKLRLQDEFHF
jgi:hypothetical protein